MDLNPKTKFKDLFKMLALQDLLWVDLQCRGYLAIV